MLRAMASYVHEHCEEFREAFEFADEKYVECENSDHCVHWYACDSACKVGHDWNQPCEAGVLIVHCCDCCCTNVYTYNPPDPSQN